MGVGAPMFFLQASLVVGWVAALGPLGACLTLYFNLASWLKKALVQGPDDLCLIPRSYHVAEEN